MLTFEVFHADPGVAKYRGELARAANFAHVFGEESGLCEVFGEDLAPMVDEDQHECAWAHLWTDGGDGYAVSWTDGVTGQWAVGFTPADGDGYPLELARLFHAFLSYVVSIGEFFGDEIPTEYGCEPMPGIGWPAWMIADAWRIGHGVSREVGAAAEAAATRS